MSTIQNMSTSQEMLLKKKNFLIEMLLKNIDEEIEVIIIKQKEYCFESFVRGYHAYMDIWTPKVDDENLCLKPESDNEHDSFAVAVLLEGKVVGHVPMNLSKLFNKFLKIPSCTIRCKVTGKRVNRGAGYGLEIPVHYALIGPDKAVSFTERCIKKILDSVDKKVRKCLK